MFVWIKKIGQVALLLVVLLALIGVNVKQVYCCHAHDLHREVIFVPDEAAETCHEGCCGAKSCHHTTRYDFYKVTDYSQVETDAELFIFSFVEFSCFIIHEPFYILTVIVTHFTFFVFGFNYAMNRNTTFK